MPDSPAEKKFDLAIVGPSAAIAGFRALGVAVFPAETAEAARKEIVRLRTEEKEGRARFAAIFLLEELAAAITPDDWKKWSQKALPAVTLLPGIAQSGLAAERMKQILERAVGSSALNF